MEMLCMSCVVGMLVCVSVLVCVGLSVRVWV